MACSPPPPIPLSCRLTVLCPSLDPLPAPAFGWVLQAVPLPTWPCTRLDGDTGDGTTATGSCSSKRVRLDPALPQPCRDGGDTEQGEKLFPSLVPPSAQCVCSTGIALSPSRRCHHHPAPPVSPRRGFRSPAPEEGTQRLHWTRQHSRTTTPEKTPELPGQPCQGRMKIAQDQIPPL